MKHLIIIMLFISTAFIYGTPENDSLKVKSKDSVTVQQDTLTHSQGISFIDKNGDGFNDLAPDHDGDGIPNGLDKDWRKLRGKGRGFQHRHRYGRRFNSPDTTTIKDSASIKTKEKVK